ncbi:hypothetical protein PSCICO_22380 [Pseudomonas cichorii]|uniref:DoxX family protein n=1 Tax=Pseudomonas serbiensis TaxID=3064350 RepID=A0ABT9CL85_9PSED|nr:MULTISPECIES: DoxX family protein [Pseudomonas]MDO7926244.1 DoxX family protein [Pseudomonas sp. KFB-138]GFM86839.1 hypothetical protein PSCICO_22380 [Pseudomonas cichorii]
MIENYAYWISTLLLSALYLVSAAMYIRKSEWVRETLGELGYPGYLVPLLIVTKILAVVVIVSRFNVGLSDLAYAGVFYHLLLSALAYIGVRKPGGALPAVVCLVLLTTSFYTQNAAREVPSPYGQVMAFSQESQ